MGGAAVGAAVAVESSSFGSEALPGVGVAAAGGGVSASTGGAAGAAGALAAVEAAGHSHPITCTGSGWLSIASSAIQRAMIESFGWASEGLSRRQPRRLWRAIVFAMCCLSSGLSGRVRRCCTTAW